MHPLNTKYNSGWLAHMNPIALDFIDMCPYSHQSLVGKQHRLTTHIPKLIAHPQARIPLEACILLTNKAPIALPCPPLDHHGTVFLP